MTKAGFIRFEADKQSLGKQPAASSRPVLSEEPHDINTYVGCLSLRYGYTNHPFGSERPYILHISQWAYYSVKRGPL